jgi:hypothetical protein
MASTNTSTDVAASREIVLRFASDPALLAEWNNEYIECGPAGTQGDEVMFRCRTSRGDAATWTLRVSEPVDGRITRVAAMIEEDINARYLLRYPVRWPRTERQRTARLAQSLARLKGFAEAAARDDGPARRGGGGLQAGDLVALLNVYTSQFGSYTTLLWQVPALGLTAQAFLMTIVLGGGSPPVTHAARYTASALSIVVALASIWLMHNQRARAINHAELAKRVSYRLSLTHLVGGTFALDDAVPDRGTDAQNVWAVNRVIYHVWTWCMYLFLATDLVVICAVLAGTRWFT